MRLPFTVLGGASGVVVITSQTKATESSEYEDRVHISSLDAQQFVFRFYLEKDKPASVVIRDQQGNVIDQLVSTSVGQQQEVWWNASLHKPGVYLMQWSTNHQRFVRRILVK